METDEQKHEEETNQDVPEKTEDELAAERLDLAGPEDQEAWGAEFLQEKEADQDVGSEEDAGTESASEDAKPDHAVEFDEDLLAAAELFGFSREEAKQFGSPNALAKTLALLDQRYQQQTFDAAEPGAAGTPEQTEENIELNPDDYGEELIKKTKFIENRIAKLESLLDQQAAFLSMRQQEAEQIAADAFYRQFDKDVEEIASELGFDETVFGKGTGYDLKSQQKTDALRNRIEIMNAMTGLAQAYAMAGKPIPAQRDLLMEAIHAKFWREREKMQLNKLSEKVSARSKQSISRATQRKSPPSVNPTVRAIHGVANKMRELGIPFDAESYEDETSLAL